MIPKFLLLLLILFCYVEVSAQSPCAKYAETIAEVNQQLARENPDAQLTFNKLRAARVHARNCNTASAGEVDEKMKVLFDKIDALKVSAENSSRSLRAEREKLIKEQTTSERLRLAAEKEKTISDSLRLTAEKEKTISDSLGLVAEVEKLKAQAATEKAEAALDRIYYYAGEYGLASEMPDYGVRYLFNDFRPKYGFINKKSETKIDFIYDEAQAFDYRGFARVSREDQNYMIDTTGKEYVYATSFSEITAKTTLLDLRRQTIKKIPRLANINIAIEVILADDNRQLITLKGLEQFYKLKLLCLSKTRVSDLSPLAGLKNLTDLDLQGTVVVDLSPLSGLTNLTELDLSDLYTEVVDLSPLSGLTNLIYLDLSNNRKLVDFSPLARLTNLAKLDLHETRIADLSPLSGLINLASLNLDDAKVTDLSPLSGLTNLASLNLEHTKVTDLSPLAVLTNLASLDLSYTNVTDISPLTGLTNLTDLNLWGNKVKDLSPLAGLINMTHLNFMGCIEIVDFSPIEELKNLAMLALSYTKITRSQAESIQTALPGCQIFWHWNKREE